MIKSFFITLFFLSASTLVMGQQIIYNSPIAKKYINDTTRFMAYPDVFLLENIKPIIACKQLEINTCWEVFSLKKQEKRAIGYKNLYRYPTPAQKLPDSVVLSKGDVSKCFASCWCPSYMPWYISVQTIDNKILTIGDTSTLKGFLGNLDNKFNAYLWMQAAPFLIRYQEEPIKTSPGFKYKKVTDGFLIIYNTIDGSASWTTYVDEIYLVTTDFKIIYIGKRNPVRSKYNYKI